MDLRKVSDEEKISLCGFAFLPFLWFVNVIWFFREAFLRDAFTGQAKLRSYVIYSFVGFLVWFAALTTWITIYQNNRASWEGLGDRLSFVIPLGEP